MPFVVATGSPDLVRILRNCEDAEKFDVRLGSVSETSAGCDVAILSRPLAAERYGAERSGLVAEVLSNGREDGAPDLIAALPVLDFADVERHGSPDYASWVEWAVASVLRALESAVGPVTELAVLLHLEAAAMDRHPCTTLAVLAQSNFFE